jgi:hypothetical protein
VWFISPILQIKGSTEKKAQGEPEPITVEGSVRYADAFIDVYRNRLICVREDHSGSGEAVNTIAAIALEGDAGTGKILISGNDFYSSPKLSPDGTHLAWLTWDHPNMPWDGCELWVGEVSPDGLLVNERWVAGGANESIFQPEWSPSGVLYFSSDRKGWWNLQRISTAGEIESVLFAERRIGNATVDFLACPHTLSLQRTLLFAAISKMVFLAWGS